MAAKVRNLLRYLEFILSALAQGPLLYFELGAKGGRGLYARLLVIDGQKYWMRARCLFSENIYKAV